MTSEFLREIVYHRLFCAGSFVIGCYGISQDPVTKNYVMVMEYGGNSLKKYLIKHNDLRFDGRFYQLKGIATALGFIHEEKLMHRDLHPGNILKYVGGLHGDDFTYITDLGLCRPVGEKDKSRTYGVLPYVAPEVLNGKPST